MASVTGIELGPDSCVLVRMRTGRGEPELSAVRVIESAEWPSHDVAVTELLAGIKRELNLPHQARVVVWGLPDSANVSDLASLVALRPIVAAGFKIDSIVSPPKALALLAASRARRGADGAQAWLALNCHGAAIAIVRGGELLVSRTFGWNYGSPFGGPNAQLLQRYSLVAHLAPEVRHAIDMVATSHGVTVELAVTCGDLPELRSLTMPLIEELDIEVETLDSTEGLSVSPRAAGDRIVESAPALRLACAAAGGPRTVARQWPTLAPPVRMAAAVVIVGGLTWLGYQQWFAQAPTPVTPAAPVAGKTAQPQSAPVPGRPSVAAPSVNAARPAGTRPEVPSSARVAPGITLPPAVPPPPPSVVKSAPLQSSKPVPRAIASPTPAPAARPTPPMVATATPPPAPAKPAPSSSSVARTTAPPVAKPSLPPAAKALPPPVVSSAPATSTKPVPPSATKPVPPAVANAASAPPSKPASPVAKAGPPLVPTASARPAPAPGSAVAPTSVPRVIPPAGASPPAATIASRPAVPAPPRTAASKPAPPRIGGSAPPAVTAPPVAMSAPPTVIPLPPAPMPQPSAPPFVPPLGTVTRDSQQGQSPLSVPPVSPTPQPRAEGARAVNPLSPGPGVTAHNSPSRPVSPPVPLKTPVPAVNSILVSPDRRLAVLDGAIVGVGDAVGLRVVVQIEPEAVILREPSGYLIRVSIRGRQVEDP